VTRNPHFGRSRETLGLALQALQLKNAFPGSKYTLDKNVLLVWEAQLQPSPLSEIYSVRISYRRGKKPEVTVIEPKLQTREDGALPHVLDGDRLCLFQPKYYEWRPRMSIADTIVPWTSLWLFHYEIWLATGKWCGANEEHPGDAANGPASHPDSQHEARATGD